MMVTNFRAKGRVIQQRYTGPDMSASRAWTDFSHAREGEDRDALEARAAQLRKTFPRGHEFRVM